MKVYVLGFQNECFDNLIGVFESLEDAEAHKMKTLEAWQWTCAPIYGWWIEEIELTPRMCKCDVHSFELVSQK